MLKTLDLPQAISSQAMSAAAATLNLYAQLGRERPRNGSNFVGNLAGCERDVQRLSTTALIYLSNVSTRIASTKHDNDKLTPWYTIHKRWILCGADTDISSMTPCSAPALVMCWRHPGRVICS